MNIQDKLAVLAGVGESVPVVSRSVKLKFFPVVKQKGWISIDDKGDHWFVLWTNRRDSHNRAGGVKCYAADFRKDTGLPYKLAKNWTGAWESAIGLWQVHTEEQEKADKIFEYIRDCIELAFDELQLSQAVVQ